MLTQLPGDNLRVVDAADGRADDAVLGGVFQRDRVQTGRRLVDQRSCQRAVSDGALRRGMAHRAGRGGALGDRDSPLCRGRRDEHLPARRADPTHRLPVEGRRVAAARPLHAVGRRVEVGLLDGHLRPVDVEFLGDQHGQHRLDALPDLRVLGHDGDAAVGRHLDERPRDEVRGRRASAGGCCPAPNRSSEYQASITPPLASAEARRNERRVTSNSGEAKGAITVPPSARRGRPTDGRSPPPPPS